MSDDPLVYVVNLERATERRAYMTYVLRNMGLTARFWPAVDGLQLSSEDPVATFDREHMRSVLHREPSLGEIGCYLSHLEILRDFVSSEATRALVLEDDIILHPDLRTLLRRIQLVRPGWDVLSLGSSNPDCAAALLGRTWLFGPYKAARPTGDMWGAGAYLISKAGAAHLLSSSSPMRMPFDHVLMGKDERSVQTVRIVTPPLAFYPPQTDSELEGQRHEVRGWVSPFPTAHEIPPASGWKGRLIQRVLGVRGRERALGTLRAWRRSLRRPLAR